MDYSHFGHPGAHRRPEHLKVKDKIAQIGRLFAVPPFNWSQVKEDTIGNVPGLFGVPDKDQNGSGSCTAQATGYGFYKATGIDINRRDLYSNTHLPGGGAYLNAPLDWLRNKGYKLLSIYPDPNPESETIMITVFDGVRLRNFILNYTYYPDTSNIDSAAWAITNHTYIHLGIDGSWTDGWANPVDPLPPAPNNTAIWGHALFACKESIVLRNGVPTIKAKSSWNASGIHCHYLTKNYFPSGVFEILGVDIKELNMGQFVQTSDTEFGLEYVTDFVTTIVKFASPQDAQEKLKNVPGALNADGTVDFSKARRINL